MRAESRDLLRQAGADLKTAHDMHTTENYYACAFFSQQAAEKALKALYIEVKREAAPFTHNLSQISKQCRAPSDVVKAARDITPEYVVARYPNAAGGPPVDLYDGERARTVLRKAEMILEWVRSKMPR